MNTTQKIITGAAVIGYSAILIMGSIFWERNLNPKHLIAEIDKESVLYEALASNPTIDAEDFVAAVEEPIMRFLNEWIEKGYVIYSIHVDANGKKQLAIEAMPQTVDLTPSFASVVNAAVAKRAAPAAQ